MRDEEVCGDAICGSSNRIGGSVRVRNRELTRDRSVLPFTTPLGRPSVETLMPGPSGLESRPLTSVEELVAYFASAGKPRADWRLGIEQEKIGVTDFGACVRFTGPQGIETLLRQIVDDGYSGSYEGTQILGANRDGIHVTVEPGGQLEFSGPTLHTAEDCRRLLYEHVREVSRLGDALGVRFLGVGFQPWAAMDEIEWLPKRRYGVMRDYLPTRGLLGLQMMKMTATVQANLDYLDEESASKKMRTAFGVTSIVTAMFAASSISDGAPNGYKSRRAAIWLDTDNSRCGLLPESFQRACSDGVGFRHYAEWALDVPMFFVVRDGIYHSANGMTFRRFMAEGWRDQRATMEDWETHLSTLFPEVRLKTYIELRGADAGPMDMASALGALWRGLLDDSDACAAAWALVRSATYGDRQELRQNVPRLGLAAKMVGYPLSTLARELVEIAASGLARLPGGVADAALLEPLRAYALAGRAPADDMLDDFANNAGDPAGLVKRWTLKAA